eukprot:1012227-Rhodomonas_salina.2
MAGKLRYLPMSALGHARHKPHLWQAFSSIIFLPALYGMTGTDTVFDHRFVPARSGGHCERVFQRSVCPRSYPQALLLVIVLAMLMGDDDDSADYDHDDDKRRLRRRWWWGWWGGDGNENEDEDENYSWL